MDNSAPRLVIVYNADSGLLNAAIDTFHKWLSPSTYPCALCALTHGPFAMKARWREFLENLAMPVEFLHRDEIADTYPGAHFALPAIAIHTSEGRVRAIVSAQELDAIENLTDLIARTRAALVDEGVIVERGRSLD